MKNQILLSLSILACIAFFATGCSKEYSASGFTKVSPVEDSFNLTIRFRPIADTSRLRFDSVYTNYWREKYSVSAFKFYVSKFDLINTDSNRVYHLNTNKYFLVNAADSASLSVKLLAPAFVYNRISFLIGIDSSGNTSGAQRKTGALDSANGMFWSAAAGYIMARLEGKSPESKQAGLQFSYQIGGYTGSNSVLQKPTLLFPFGQYLNVGTVPGTKCIINIDADVNGWFFNPHQVKIADHPTCTAPGPMAKDISENYSKMFNVTGIVNQ